MKNSSNVKNAAAPALRTARTRRQLQALETKRRIYNAAIALINEKGLKNVSIEDITTAANVAKGSFYTHFDSKEALVFYTYAMSDEIYEEAWEKIQHYDFLKMVDEFIRITYTEYEKRGKGIVMAIISNYFTDPEVNVYGSDRALLKCLSAMVESGKRSCALDASTPTDYYVRIMLSAMIGTEVLWCFDRSGLRLSDMIEQALIAVTKGLTLESEEKRSES